MQAVVLAVELAVVTGIGGGLLFPARAQEGETGEGGVLFSGRTAEGIWRLTGGHLSGSLDGPVTIDQVEVQHGSLHIRAEQGLWLPESEIVELRGAVTIRDSTRTLWADRGFYHRGRQQLELEENVRGEGPEGRFEADRLRYDRQQRTLTLSGSIRMHEDDRTLSCSWLHYDLADSTGRAGEPVLIQAAADSVDIHGRLLFHDRRAGKMTIVGAEGERPRLERHFGGDAAPVVVTADTLEMATQRREGEARGAVEVVYEGAEAACERALFLMASDRIALIGRPYLWDEEGVIAGDSMAVQLQGARADRMIVWGRARSEYRPAQRPAERYFAVGDTLTAYLEGGRVRSVLLEGKAEALFLPAPEARAEGTGLNWTQAARLRLAMGDEGVERIQFEGQADGTYIAPYKGGADGGERPAAEGMGETGGESSDPQREGVPAAGDSAQVRPGGPAEDLLGGLVAPVEGEYAPFILARIREGARQGLLKPDAELLARLPFDLREEVRYEGDRIDFDVAAEVMTIEGQGAVHYQTMGLRSEQIAFYVARDLVVAQGEPVLSDRDSEVAGTEMTYRIDRGQGLIFQGRSELDTGHYRGERIKRADSEALFVREGEFSTCDQESTHYHFHASRMKIIPGERVVARPVVLYIGRIPILAIPFAVFPIRSGRQSGLLVPDTEFGFDSSRGRFLRNIGYYWAPSDYVDALLWVDYYEEEPSTILNLKTNYRLRYRLSGSLEASYARQGDEEQGRSDRWLFRIGHDQTLGERASLKISGQFQSDKDYAGDRDFGASVDERINQVLRSQLSFNQSWSSASLSVYADRTENLDDPGNEASVRISQAIPSVNLSLNSLPLGVKPNARGRGGRLGWLASTYLRGDLRLRSVYSKTWGGTRETNQAAGLGLTLSDNRRLLGILSLSPSASLSAAYAREDAAGGKNRTGMSWSTGLSAGTVLYGTFLPRLGPWEGLRHVVELNASYSYRPELTSLKDFPSVGGIGLSSSKASSLTLRATQRFHLKWRVGDRSEKAENVLVWGTSTSYDFLAAEKVSGDQKPRYWSDVSHSIRIDPGSFLSTDLSITHDPERWRDDYQLSLRNTLRLNGGGAAAPATSAGVEGYGGFGDPAAGIDAGPGGGTGLASLAGPWHMTLSHVLSKSAGARERSSANLSLGLSLTPAWRIQYSLYYDLTEKDVTSQGYSLYRDLHCWQAMFERRESGGRSSYYFRVSIKELPDIKYERRRF